MELFARNPNIHYVDPTVQLNAGIWTLWSGATAFLIARIWTKTRRGSGLWWDDYILIASWLVLTANDCLICAEYATGYVKPIWGDRMHIMIIVSSCGTLIGLSLTKTAFAVTLLKLTRGFKHWRKCHAVLWFCIVTMCSYNFAKCVVEWGKVCDDKSYDKWYRLDFCLHHHVRNRFKENGNIYNIVMDFVFAAYPWIITWNLSMTRQEKIGLCLTMSLGILVAIESAIRTEWKYHSQKKDEWYFWNNAMSNIWYSSEVAGTIIVQCVPVLRPLLKELHSTLRSKKLASSSEEHALETGRWRGPNPGVPPGERAAGWGVGWGKKWKVENRLEIVDKRLVDTETGVETVCYHAK
ncbi:integral membrane [Teratosphaeria destructans]|uniref:Integral membrane n=1 Tax=Teratosphaeria destructans TaxID=418781 RepID=A0A9W7W437_9PEZI|nr:integral membrane [Teratosphaeria destructans]